MRQLNRCSLIDSGFSPTFRWRVKMLIKWTLSMWVKYFYPLLQSHCAWLCFCPEEMFPQLGSQSRLQSYTSVWCHNPSVITRANITSHCRRVTPSNSLFQRWMGVFFFPECLTVIGGWPSESVNNIMKTSFTPGGLGVSVKLRETLNAFCCSFHRENFSARVDVWMLVNFGFMKGEYRRRAAGGNAMTQGSQRLGNVSAFFFFSSWAWKTTRQLKTGRCKRELMQQRERERERCNSR